jgi:hypothetical protein
MTKNMAMTEVQGMILERLIEAMETDMALPIRVGPKSFGSSMPEYVHTEAENYKRELEDRTEDGGQRWKDNVRAENRRTERRARCSPERISRMEQAFSWVGGAVFDEDARQVLLAYAEIKARGWDWGRYLNNRNRRNSQKKAWVKRTVQRWIVRSLQLIELHYFQSGTIWLPEAALQVAHGTAKQAGKSITSDLHAWTAPDEKPASQRM